MKQDFTSTDIEAIARELLGEPNTQRSSKSELRFDTGTYGTCVCIAGTKKGTWFDHDADEGGGVLDLVQKHKGMANGEAFGWLREMGIEVGPAPQTDQRIVARRLDQQFRERARTQLPDGFNVVLKAWVLQQGNRI